MLSAVLLGRYPSRLTTFSWATRPPAGAWVVISAHRLELREAARQEEQPRVLGPVGPESEEQRHKGVSETVGARDVDGLHLVARLAHRVLAFEYFHFQ